MGRKLAVFIVLTMFVSMTTLAFAEQVYVTKNGKKYHTAECPLIITKSPQKISKEEAVEKGLKPCSKCFKDEVSLETKKQKKLKEVN